MQKNSDTGILEGLPDDVWDGIMQDTEPERFRFNEDAKTLDELLPDDVAVSLMGLEDEVQRQRYKNQMRDVARRGKFVQAFDAQIRAYEKQAAAERKEQKAAEQAEREANRDHTIRLTGAPLAGLSCYRWTVTNRGIEGANGKICPHPLLITERLNNLDTGTQKVRLAWPRQGKWRSVAAKRSVIASRNAIIALADHAIAVNSDNAPEMVKYLADLEADNENGIPVKNSLDRVGWVGQDQFMPYSQECVYDGEEEYSDFFAAIKPCGDYNAWRAAVKKCRTDSLPFRALLAASFAGPLLWKTGALTFFVDLWGSTEAGKTTAAKIAISVWGHPDRLTSTFNATDVSLERTASLCHSIPLLIDERETKKDADKDGLTRTIYQLSMGRSKGRGTRGGGVERIREWRIPILTTGEAPLTGDYSKAGAINRVVEIECRSMLFADPGAMMDLVRENYGYAGKEFVEFLLNADIREIKTTLSAFQKYLRDNTDITDKLAASLAHMGLADFLSSMVIFGLDKGTALDEAKNMVTRISEGMVTRSEMDDTNRAWEFVTGWVAGNSNHFIKAYDVMGLDGSPVDPDTASMSYTETWGRMDEEGKVVVIAERLRKALVDNGFNPKKCLSGFADLARLECQGVRGHGKTLTQKVSINKVRTSCYILKMEQNTP